MNLFPFSSNLASSLALPDAPRARSLAATAAGTSATTSLESESMEASPPSTARRVTSSRSAPPSLELDSLPGLVAQADLRALVIEQFGSRSPAASNTQSDLDLRSFLLEQVTAKLGTTAPNAQGALSRESNSLGQSLTASSPNSASLFGAVDDALVSWRMTEPADTNGDCFVSALEEFSYSRTHSKFPTL